MIQLELPDPDLPTTQALVCDQCGRAYYRNADARDDDALRNRAVDRGWHVEPDQDQCPRCWRRAKLEARRTLEREG